MTYYAIGNTYKSETSSGFANTEYVVTFSTRRDRDEWVKNHPQAVRACTREEAIDSEIGNHTSVGKLPPSRRRAMEIIIEDNEMRAFQERTGA